MTEADVPDHAWGEDATRDLLTSIDRDPTVVARLQILFCEATHVFNCHAEGHWSIEGGGKDTYARDLIPILRQYPGLVPRLLDTRHRVVQMITHRALVLEKTGSEA